MMDKKWLLPLVLLASVLCIESALAGDDAERRKITSDLLISSDRKSISIDLRAWTGVSKVGASDVDLSKEVCKPQSSSRDLIYKQMEANRIQLNIRDSLGPMRFDDANPSEALGKWLDYTVRYEATLYQMLLKEMGFSRFDYHVQHAKTVITEFLASQTQIPDSLRYQMISDVNSVTLLNAERIARVSNTDLRDDLTLSYLAVCGPDHSSINAFYRPLFTHKSKDLNAREDLSGKFLGHYIVICPQYLLHHWLSGHRDSEFAWTIGHEVGHAIDPRNHTTLSYRDQSQINVDYRSVYSRMHSCLGQHFNQQFIGLPELVEKLAVQKGSAEKVERLRRVSEILKKELGRDLVSYDSYMGEIAADFWGTLTMAGSLARIDSPLTQVHHLRGNLSLSCREGGELGDGVHPPASFRIEQATQYSPIREILAKANQWQVVERPFCGL